MRLTVIFAALGLTACTTTPAIESALAPLVGQPVQLVVDRLGPPSGSTQAGADTVYIWNQTSMVPGVGMRSPGVGLAVPPAEGGYSSGFSSGAAFPVECNVQIVADAEGRIKESQYIGGRGGCRDPARKLSQLAYSE